MASSTARIAPSEDAYAAWRRAVAGVLARTRDPERIGPEPERALTATTYDGIAVAPLYTGRDELPEPPAPGQWPFTRGRTAVRDAVRAWHVCERFDGEDPAVVGAAVRAALENGTSALWLAGTACGELERLLAGVQVDLVPLVLEPGADPATAAARLGALADLADAPADPAGTARTLDVCLGVDPCSALVRGEPADLGAAAAVAVTAAGARGDVRALLVDGTLLHEAGASDATEIGTAVAAGIELLRALTAAGLAPDVALRQIDFRFAATDDQFQTIAKLRAARTVWARVAQVTGAPDAGGMRQHAVTSAAMTSPHDPWVNLLRTTIAAFAAGVAGADLVTVRRFDEPVEGGLPGTAPGFAARIARNIQLLLLEESHLGRVLDPAAGSWYVESLTARLADAAWGRVRELEAAGGFAAAARAGTIAAQVATTRAARDADVAHRRVRLTGVNEFPDLAEPPAAVTGPTATGPLAPRRYGHAFEALRTRSDRYLARQGRRPAVVLATLGPRAEHTARAGFVTTLLASGGIAAVYPDAGHDEDGLAGLTAALAESGTRTAVLCGTDEAYARRGADTVRELRAAGAAHVLVVGTAPVPGTDGRLAAGDDAVAALADLLDRLGAP